MKLRTLFSVAVVAAAIAPGAVMAESAAANGGGPLSASANVDFRVVVPQILVFQVGSAGTVIDEVIFDLSTPVLIDQVGVGSNITATTNGALATTLISNAGAVAIESSTLGSTGLVGSGGNTDTISFSKISTLTSNPSLPAPALRDNGTQSVSVPDVAGLTFQTGTWTYRYLNDSVYTADDYTGRATYTASTP